MSLFKSLKKKLQGRGPDKDTSNKESESIKKLSEESSKLADPVEEATDQPVVFVKPVEEQKLPGDEYGFAKHFLPEDYGKYHRSDQITEMGWGDLDYVIQDLSTMPVEAGELLQVLNDPDSSSTQVAKICEKSVALTAMVLKLVNSPFYGLSEPVDDITRAVTLLGFNEIRQIIIAMSVFKESHMAKGAMKIDDLWTHCIASARITSWLIDRIKVPMKAGLTGTGAILHDIGKFVLMKWRPGAFIEAMEDAEKNGTTLMEEELKHMGLNHALAGVLLLDQWNLPDNLKSLIKGSHLPELDRKMPEMALIYLAEQIARQQEQGDDGDQYRDEISPDLKEFLKLSVDTLTELSSDDFADYAEVVLTDLSVGFVA